ncbi:endonuclease VII [Gordonia phage Brylie]|uniref:Endonuclease VII n=1 Tax=Gordonia phage Brylie TaxID=2507859 RepID=A0A410TCW3_9CAUD|nr:endonuclease VII [Gordonia phage Brylie]
MTENETAGDKTAAAATTSTVACKDCRAEGITKVRPTPHRGPRCHTHHQRHTAATKKRNAERRRERTYGLEAADAELVLAEQGGGCAVCGPRVTGKTRKLAVDHDHKTGVVRGLLCNQCNRILIGRYDVAALTRAIAYLLDPPAPRALGRNVVVPGHPAAALEQNAGADIETGERPVFVCGGDDRPGPREDCPHPLHDYPLPAGYSDAAEMADSRLANGWTNDQCDTCGLFGWRPPNASPEFAAQRVLPIAAAGEHSLRDTPIADLMGEVLADAELEADESLVSFADLYTLERVLTVGSRRPRIVTSTALPPNGPMLAIDSKMSALTDCGHAGGTGIGAGHECRCNRTAGHPLDSGRPHGCGCGAMWADQ